MKAWFDTLSAHEKGRLLVKVLLCCWLLGVLYVMYQRLAQGSGL